MRDIDEIANELFSHPDFVVGNFLTKQHLIDAGYELDKVHNMDWAADPISDTMWECVDSEIRTNEESNHER
jgi:hypothetical protein